MIVDMYGIREATEAEMLSKVPGTNKCLWTIAAEAAIYGHTSGGMCGVYGAFEVTLRLPRKHSYQRANELKKGRVDYITQAGDHIGCYELKATKADLKSKAALTFIGTRNYLLVYPTIAQAAIELAPEHVGVLVYGHVQNGRWYDYQIRSVKKCRSVEPQIPVEMVKEMMFHSMSRDAGNLARIKRRQAAEEVLKRSKDESREHIE